MTEYRITLTGGYRTWSLYLNARNRVHAMNRAAQLAPHSRVVDAQPSR